MSKERQGGESGERDGVEDVRLLVQVLRRAERVAALTGAGISTAAGFADFRGPQGIYVTHAYPESVFDLDAFFEDPRGFYAYARDFLRLRERARPTFAHAWLAQLEREGRLLGVVTQNIDGLHQRAGNRTVIELHGGFDWSVCLSCGRRFETSEIEPEILAARIPRCGGCGGLVKPDIVFFGEAVHDIEQAEQIVGESDLLLVVGSSLTVFPAAGLPERAGGEVVVVTRGPAGLPRGAKRIDADIDPFLRAVADALAAPEA